jgi:hypothetical protein
MDRLLARLERRLGRYAVENVAAYIIGGMVLVFLLASTRLQFLSLLRLSPSDVAHGQVWRLVSYLFIPPWTDFDFRLFTLFWLFFTLSMGWTVISSLEGEWGAFKLNVYYLFGMAGTTAAAFITQVPLGNAFLNMSLILAFATLFPDYEILLFLIIPIRMKWLGWLAFAYTAYAFVSGDWGARGAILAAFSNYLLFFWGDIARTVRGGARVRARQVRASSVPPPRLALEGRACAICGAREGDGADIRVCSCEKCKAAPGGQTRTLCLEHARSH